MQQGLQAQTRAQRQGNFEDNSNIETKIGEIELFCASPVRLFIQEGKKFVLFCFVVMRSTKLGCFRSCSCLWKSLTEEGCMGLVP
jgi:hypothetical protein